MFPVWYGRFAPVRLLELMHLCAVGPWKRSHDDVDTSHENLRCRRRLLGVARGTALASGQALAVGHYGPLHAVASTYLIAHEVPPPVKTLSCCRH